MLLYISLAKQIFRHIKFWL